jgi:uncharacterized Zn finger protein
MFGEGTRGLHLETLDPPAPRCVRLEGAGFFVHGRVRVVAARRGRVRAVVRGARPYDVTFETDDAGRLEAACDCVAFREHPAVCRHLWAALIKVQNEGLLADPAPRDAPRPIAAP